MRRSHLAHVVNHLCIVSGVERIYSFHMPKSLAEWLQDQGKGSLTRLMHDSRLAWATVSRAARGKRVGVKAAVRISRATNGEVTEATLLHEPEDEPRAVA